MASSSFTRFDPAERFAEVEGLTDAELGAWFRLVVDLWENGPKPSRFFDGKPSGLLVEVEGGYSLAWIEQERKKVDIRKRAAMLNGSKGGRPRKSKRRTQRVIQANAAPLKVETEPVTVKKEAEETQPVTVPKPLESAVRERENNGESNEGVKRGAQAKKRTARIVRTLFEESTVNTIELFRFSFEGIPGMDCVDLDHYFEAVRRWSKAKGERRADWIETAKTFMARDNEAGKLKMLPGISREDQQLLDYLKE